MVRRVRAVRRGLGKGRGKGYKNIMGKDPVVHSQSAKGMKQPQRVRHIPEPKKPKFIPFIKMIEEVKEYVNEIAKKIDNSDFVVEWNQVEDVIEIRTDSTMYETLYDPSSSDIPYLMKDSMDEMGVPESKRPKVDVYKKQEEFIKWAEKKGWELELYGGGIIHLYPMK